ncbi:hypothetical protein [Noviherbaspirillum galbum]|uniref:hypothetical protein n=1 Tax=Noviherbaspirillum galbum TaxID=2709383 RepID=UPI0013D63A8C|nr:hypothetical protein [Noviherbaspirillum galbum]
MKTSIKPPKPRNPHVVTAKFRQAGAHGAIGAAKRARREENQALRRQLRRTGGLDDA